MPMVKAKKNIMDRDLFIESENSFQLSHKQRELCRRLNNFYKISLNREDFSPSALFQGALFAMSPIRRRQNPDWMAQTAHSLRDILYPFYSSKAVVKSGRALMQYGSAGNVDNLAVSIGQYNGFLTDVAHHI